MCYPTLCLHTQNGGSVLHCLYRSAKLTSRLHTLKTTDQNITICTTDIFFSLLKVIKQGKKACHISLQSLLEGTNVLGTSSDSDTGCFPKVGDFNTGNISSLRYTLQPSYWVTRWVRSGVPKPTTTTKTIPPFGKEAYLHGFQFSCMNLVFSSIWHQSSSDFKSAAWHIVLSKSF